MAHYFLLNGDFDSKIIVLYDTRGGCGKNQRCDAGNFIRVKQLNQPDRTGPDRTGPDRTGPDRTGPDRTGTGPDRTGPDRTGPDRTGPDREYDVWVLTSLYL